MHLLNAQPGSIDDNEPVDLEQTPADVVFISAADTELAGLAEARSDHPNPPTLRLANLTHLQHPMSVDLHIEQCATKSKLAIARCLGGTGYWKYGLEQYAIQLGQAGIPFAALPGDDKPDEDLWRLSTVPREDWENLWAYMVEGGTENNSNFLSYAASMVNDGEKPVAAKPLLRAGLYWPGAGIADLAAIRESWAQDAPVVPIIFTAHLSKAQAFNP